MPAKQGRKRRKGKCFSSDRWCILHLRLYLWMYLFYVGNDKDVTMTDNDPISELLGYLKGWNDDLTEA